MLSKKYYNNMVVVDKKTIAYFQKATQKAISKLERITNNVINKLKILLKKTKKVIYA